MIHRIVEEGEEFILIRGDGEEVGRYSSKANAMRAISARRKKEVVEEVKEEVKEIKEKVKKVFKKK